MMDATIYSRWSSLEQGKGTSAERQQERCVSFCYARGWCVVERITDEGRSAWTGDNIANGNLANFAARIRREGGTGKVLVVEKLDRLSRQAPLTMAAWLQDMVATGLTIATADGRHTINATDLARNQMQVLGVIFEAFRGFDESQAKSDRVADAWAKKRERGAPMSARCPAWLKPVGSTSYKHDQSASRYVEIDDRAALVRWMFDQSASGIGTATIAAKLNARGEPVWGRGNGWHASYIKKILANSACIGEYQPCTKPKGGERAPAGEPIRDYFPGVVPLELWQLVNTKRAQRIRREQSGRNRLVNLLAGLARCSHCGGGMTFLDKGAETLANGQIVPRQYLKCSRIHRSLGGCDNRRSYNYNVIANAILDELLHLAMDDQHFTRPDDVAALEVEAARLRRDQDDGERRQQAALRMVEDDPDDELARQRYRQHRDAVKETKAALASVRERLAETRGKVSPSEHIRRVTEVRAMMESDDADERYQARVRVKLALNDLVESVSCSGRRRRVWVALMGGLRTINFNLCGEKGEDLDFVEIAPSLVKVEKENPVAAAYIRRKSQHISQK